MNGGIADDPLARSLLRHLATERGADDPLGSFAHTVLDGEMSLREAADNPWHSQGLAAAVQKAQTALDRMSLSERAEIERTARQLAGRTPEKTRLPGETNGEPGQTLADRHPADRPLGAAVRRDSAGSTGIRTATAGGR